MYWYFAGILVIIFLFFSIPKWNEENEMKYLDLQCDGFQEEPSFGDT